MVNTQIIVTLLLNGISYAMLLFLISVGLSLIFGVMGVVNFAHGVVYALGAYAATSIIGQTGSFWLALIIAPLLVVVVSILIEYFSLRPMYDRDPVYQVLLTFGLLLVLQEGIKLVWGTQAMNIQTPALLLGATDLGITYYPTYRLFVIVVGLCIGVALWALIQKTKLGIVVRAGTVDREMVEVLGINIDRIFTFVFALGFLLAAVSGIISAPLVGVYPGMGTEVLIQAFVVVVVGGLGSLHGTFVSAVLIGLIWTGVGFFQSSMLGFTIFVLMLVMLIFRPRGLLGQPGVFTE